MEEDNKPKKLIELLADPSFVRWITGKATPDEASSWENWKSKDPEHLDLHIKARVFISAVQIQSAYDASPEDEWQRLVRKLDRRELKSPFIRFRLTNSINYGIAAAVVFVTVSAFLAWFYIGRPLNAQDSEKPNMVVINTAYGEQAHITMPDGSRIVLGAHSRLTHTRDWLKQQPIKVGLSGKAYFDIVESGKRTSPRFVITTPDGLISDWGTQFMVDTYHHRTRVVLERGDVRISKDTKTKAASLHPGQMAEFSHDDLNIHIRKVNPKVYTSWASDHLVFDHTPLKEAVDYLENTYGVIVKSDEPDLMNKKLTGELKNGSLDELTHAIARVLSIRIIHTGDTLMIEPDIRK